jgi:hypothetical protein
MKAQKKRLASFGGPGNKLKLMPERITSALGRKLPYIREPLFISIPLFSG